MYVIDNSHNHKLRGFTIVGLLIVIVVIAIFAAIAVVAFNGIQNRANITVTSSNINIYHKAISQYAVDNNSVSHENVAGLDVALRPYLGKLPSKVQPIEFTTTALAGPDCHIHSSASAPLYMSGQRVELSSGGIIIYDSCWPQVCTEAKAYVIYFPVSSDGECIKVGGKPSNKVTSLGSTFCATGGGDITVQ